MISVNLLKNSTRLQPFLNHSEDRVSLYQASTDTANYFRKNLKFFLSSFCEKCKKNLNLNADKFVKEK